MRVKIIEIIVGWWKNEQRLLKDGEIDIHLIPQKDDIIYLDGERYRVLQRDFVSWNPQEIKLFVSKL